jgi:queuine tRNA-ribosyltransferase
MRLNFRLEAGGPNSLEPGTQARAGRFRTLHNEVLTPLFMPVGTQATVKAQLPSNLEEAGSQILLANTYHLLLRPGPEIFRKLGGIHKLMSWKRSVLTDSGGFQIFSLNRQLDEKGAVFRSHLDGRKILLTPESSIDTQQAIGSDIMMALDQCVPSTVDHATALDALGITYRWAQRSLAARGDSPQSLFGIVQGALFEDLRRQSAAQLGELAFDGFAIGGLAVGEEKHEREDMCEFTARLLPQDRPRYLMGVGTPLDILEAVHRGVDMFDCVLPTKIGGRGGAYTSRGHVQLRRGVYRTADEPLDPNCACPTCARYSRAYLSHLTRAGEVLGWTLIGSHNLWFYHQLMRDIRQSILEGRFLELYRERREYLQEDDLDNPIHGPKRNARKAREKASKEAPTRLGDYQVVISPQGFANIRQISSGETMHAKVAPIEEAVRLYVEQSRLAARVRVSAAGAEPLVIWDVGLGAAANAMAAIACYEREADKLEPGQHLRPMRIVSFENDLDSLRLAVANGERFAYLRHGGPAAILEKGRWESKKHPGLTWELLQGDFAPTPDLPSPSLIFFDLFSTKTQGADWGMQAFTRLFNACGAGDCELFTYSSSTGVRVALIGAGFHVARGLPSCDRPETTIALTPRAAARVLNETPAPFDLLGSEWLGRWHRSGAKFPPELLASQQPEFERAFLEHAQWR